jgi:two-component system, chemotaxis family, sensor kinase CheA
MKISEDITQEELAVFMQEADEQLKLLNEDFILLEKAGENPQLLQEIFRASHTLKGSSGMLGYEKMSQVAHAMETVLDKLRNGSLKITSQLVDALLQGLDTLKLLRDKLVSDDKEEVDISKVTSDLGMVANGTPGATAVNATESLINVSEINEKIRESQEKGYNIYKISVSVDSKSSWVAVRYFQLISELSQIGQIIKSAPSKEDIEAGKATGTMELFFACSQDSAGVKNAIDAVPEIISSQIDIYDGQNETIEHDNGKANLKQNEKAVQDKGNAPAKKSLQLAETVRVDVRLLDNLMNLIGEMVIDRNRIRQISRELEIKYENDSVVETLGETSAHVMKIVNDLQENILKARMLHIGTIVNGFPRMVRDLAQKANKQVDFIIEGQETELDRSIIEQIRDPLLHLLRNAVDHGLEDSEKRRTSGKPEKGTIRLSARQEQSYILISVSDDGGGIDVEKVKQKAVNKGYISADEASRLNNTDALNLILLSGLSTADKITEISGRGVGMDVVKTNVEGLGGSLTIDSKVNVGTTFTIRLPLTLATIDGILVSSGGLTYVVPISVIVEILSLRPEQIKTVMGKEVFQLRENIIPLLRLNQKFAQDSSKVVESEGSVVVVTKIGTKLTGLVVDSVMEPQESVVKSLGKYVGSVKGVSGATIMGDGQVALILDTATLTKDS